MGNSTSQTVEDLDINSILNPDDSAPPTYFNNLSTFDKERTKLSWSDICNVVKHEMYPKLASAMRSIIDEQQDTEVGNFFKQLLQNFTSDNTSNIGLYDIEDQIDKVIEYL